MLKYLNKFTYFAVTFLIVIIISGAEMILYCFQIRKERSHILVNWSKPNNRQSAFIETESRNIATKEDYGNHYSRFLNRLKMTPNLFMHKNYLYLSKSMFCAGNLTTLRVILFSVTNEISLT